jgi:hypothetical protein
MSKKEWLNFSIEDGFTLKSDAPKELWDSYHNYQKQVAYYEELERKTGYHYI